MKRSDVPGSKSSATSSSLGFSFGGWPQRNTAIAIAYSQSHNPSHDIWQQVLIHISSDYMNQPSAGFKRLGHMTLFCMKHHVTSNAICAVGIGPGIGMSTCLKVGMSKLQCTNACIAWERTKGLSARPSRAKMCRVTRALASFAHMATKHSN